MTELSKKILEILPIGEPADIDTLNDLSSIRNHAGSSAWCANRLGVNTRNEDEFKPIRVTLANLANAGKIHRIKTDKNRFIYYKCNNEFPAEIITQDVASRMLVRSKKFFTKSSNIDVFLDPDEMRVATLDIETSSLKADFGVILGACIHTYGTREKPIVLRTDLSVPDLFEAEIQTVTNIVDVMCEYDGCLTFYGRLFDIPYLYTKCKMHDIDWMGKKKHLDLWFTTKRYIKASSRRLDQINQILQFKHPEYASKTRLGMKEWNGAAYGRSESDLDYIIDHCIKDVEITENVCNEYRDVLPDKVMRM